MTETSFSKDLFPDLHNLIPSPFFISFLPSFPVLGKEHARVFPFVFNRACKTLRKSFGYELVELRARGTENEQLRAQAMGQQSQAQEEEEQEEEEEGTNNAKGKKAASAAAKKRKRNSNGNGEEEGDGDESVSKTKGEFLKERENPKLDRERKGGLDYVVISKCR